MAFAEEEEDDGWGLFWPEVLSEEEEDVEWMPEEDVWTEVEEEVGWTAEEEVGWAVEEEEELRMQLMA